MNLDMNRVIDFFSLKYGVLHRLGLDGILACSNESPSEPNDINKLWFVQVSGAFSYI